MTKSDWTIDHLIVLQTDIDDESPEVLAAVIPMLLNNGALDAHLTPLMMKKGRPGQRLEVLCREENRADLLRHLFRETSTLGVKVLPIERYALPRRTESIAVDGHDIRVKLATLDGEVLRAVPEFEDCQAVATKTGRPLREVMDAARAKARRFLPNIG
ncbi:MAG: DUF111 family protein [Candidatus Sumerlaeia bacterium]|nr:DUF111 family protein [Candidatus Sumerlaeia bacterium]